MNLIEISNKAGKIRLTESVSTESMDRLCEEITHVFGATAHAEGADFGEITNCIENATDTLDIEIHSPGGSVLDGYRLYHALLELRGRGVHVTATINSLAASMASVIAMAADKIRMVKGGRMMIHEASGGIHGNADEIARYAQVLDSISEEIADIYAGRTGAKPEDMRELMRKETWMTADEAVSMKFADEVIQPTPKKGKATAALEAIEKALAIGGVRPTSLGMSFFSSKAELQQKVEALDKELESANKEVEAIAALLKTSKDELATAREALAQSPTAEVVAKLTAERDNAIAAAAPEKIEAAALALVSKDEPPAAVQKVIAARVTEALAAAGAPTPVADVEGDKGVKTITRAEFQKLSPHEQGAHFRNGGKITD